VVVVEDDDAGVVYVPPAATPTITSEPVNNAFSMFKESRVGPLEQVAQ
jgi:hypothetical protein